MSNADELADLGRDRLVSIVKVLADDLAKWMESEMASTGMGVQDVNPDELIGNAISATGA